MKTCLIALVSLTTLANPGLAQDPDADAGKGTYVVCLACHGPDGKGLKAGDKVMAPSLAGSAIANGDPEVFPAVILKGIRKEGEEYLQAMAPLPLKDEQLAAVMTYVRSNFGNKAPAVTAGQVAEYRKNTKDLPSPLSRKQVAELAGKK